MTTVHNGVVVITGAACGHGRSHGEARVGAGYDVIAIGRCADIAAMPNPLATREDLDAAAGLVKSVRHRERQSPLNHWSDPAGCRAPTAKAH